MKYPAILLAANPKVVEPPELGDVEAHIEFINQSKLGSVNWNLIRMFRIKTSLLDYYNLIKKGYIYNVSTQNVNYISDINWIKRGDQITENDKKYYPDWRMKNPEKDWIVVNFTNFTELKNENKLNCSDFKRYENGANLARNYVRNYVIVEEY